MKRKPRLKLSNCSLTVFSSFLFSEGTEITGASSSFHSRDKDAKKIDLRTATILDPNDCNRKNKTDKEPLCGFNILMQSGKMLTLNTETIAERDRWLWLLNEWKEYFKWQTRHIKIEPSI
jgi:hypothetical protein